MKGLLTQTACSPECAPHLFQYCSPECEPIVGEVLPYPHNVLETHGEDWRGGSFQLDLALYADHVLLRVEDGDYECTVVRLLPEQAKALYDALGVALYGC